MYKVANIAKNTSYLTLALIMQKVISFTYFAILARNLGPEDLGKYYFAISFTTIFAIFIDLGLVNVLTREVAKIQAKAGKLLGNIMAIKLPLALTTLLVVILTINLLGYGPLVKNLVYLSSICMLLDSFTATFYAVIRGFHNLKYESIGSVGFMATAMAFGLVALYSGLGLAWIMGGLVAASIFNFIFATYFLKRKWQINIRPQYDKSAIGIIIKLSIPFGIFAVLQRVYTYLDSVLLSILAGDRYVGLYQVAFKIIFALQFLPLAFTASLYPAMSAYWESNREQLVVTFERAMNYLIIISLPIALGTIFLADKIILIFKSGYTEAILPLQLVIASLLFLFINFPIGSLLNACERQKINTINMAIVAGASIILNIIFIPRWQAVGASLTVLATNILMFGLGIYWVPKIIKIRPIKIISVFLKSLTAGIFMSLLIFYLKADLNIIYLVIIGALSYFFVLFILKAFNKADLESIYKSFKKKAV